MLPRREVWHNLIRHKLGLLTCHLQLNLKYLHGWLNLKQNNAWGKIFTFTYRRQDLWLWNEAVGQFGGVVPVVGDDLCPGNLVASQWLMRKSCRDVPPKNGRHVSSLHLKGCSQVDRLHLNLLAWNCRRKENWKFDTSFCILHIPKSTIFFLTERILRKKKKKNAVNLWNWIKCNTLEKKWEVMIAYALSVRLKSFIYSLVYNYY